MSVYKKNELTTSFLIKLNCPNTSIRYTVIRILSTEFEFFLQKASFKMKKLLEAVLLSLGIDILETIMLNLDKSLIYTIGTKYMYRKSN